MSAAKMLVLIAMGYVLALVGGAAVVAVYEQFIPAEVLETSGGMVAFGDMILFVLFAGFFSLAPTWFLLKLSIEVAPRTLLAAVLLIAALGPASWLAVASLATAVPPNLPHATSVLFGLLIAFCAIPRIVAGPVVLVVEGAAFFLIRQRAAHALLAAAMLMDVVPLSMYALHLSAVTYR